MDLPRGVYRLRSYLSSTGAEGQHERGGHGGKEGMMEGTDEDVFFLVDEGGWREGDLMWGSREVKRR